MVYLLRVLLMLVGLYVCGTQGITEISFIEGESIIVTCYEYSMKLAHRKPSNRSIRYPKAEFNECPTPNVSYASLLRTLNVHVPEVQVLVLSLPLRSTSLHATHFEGLYVQNLSIYGLEIQYLDQNFLDPLVNTVKRLAISYAELRRLPEANLIEWAKLLNGISQGTWGGCTMLKDLHVEKWEVPEQPVDGGWLAHCPVLSTMHVAHLSPYSVQRVLRGARQLIKLVVNDSNLKSVDLVELLGASTKLQHLDLSRNDIFQLPRDTFEHLKSLAVLNLSDNDLTIHAFLVSCLVRAPVLRDLSLSGNKMFPSFCEYISKNETYGEILMSILPLERLSLKKVGAKDICFNDWKTLTYLDLSYNEITTLKIQNLPIPKSTIELNLKSNPIKEAPLTEAEYKYLVASFNKTANSINASQVINMTILVDWSPECDCEHAWLVRALRSLPLLNLDGARCANAHDAEIKRAPPQYVNCDQSECMGCLCRRRWSDNTTDVDCSNRGLETIPRHVYDFPGALHLLDLRDNEVRRVDEATAKAMFAESGRRWRLAGNLLVCDCNNTHLLQALQKHHLQVEDYDNLTCLNNGLPVHEVVIDELCVELGQVGLTAALAASGALVALLALGAALYYRYGREMKVFLYARGWCLYCVREEELDADRPYDAFVSFSHRDEQLVVEKLLPKLEQEPNSYRLCVHFRDWNPGELISTQIMQSVQRSRRTIIMLSRNFLESVWGMLEFRTAHVSALQEGRARLIVVVLDDVVDDEDLGGELRGYLRTNTYVRWNDPWFWDKLRYALPHHRRAARADDSPRATTRL